MSFRENFLWSQRFIDPLRRIVGPLMVEQAPEELDLHYATDLIVMRGGNVEVAARVRRHTYLERYGDEFTIRCRTAFDAETERDKIIKGFGTHMIYGFANEAQDDLEQWAVLDLCVFRGWHSEQLAQMPPGRWPGWHVPNRDGSQGRAYRIDWLPQEFVVERRLAVAA